ncbi:MAG: nucleotide-binding protein [Actinomycetota bacterium]|nr:nucleotide-binding protein [Actinomycetota bacterium]
MPLTILRPTSVPGLFTTWAMQSPSLVSFCVAKYRMFIGSSTESAQVAKALASHFKDSLCEPSLWQNAFALGKHNMENLRQAVDDHQFAAFVFTPDDEVISRGSSAPAPRDNVILEMGLFSYRYGTERSFAVLPEDERVKIPSDLLGITFATYMPPGDDGRQDHNRWKNALTDAAEQIRGAMTSASKSESLAQNSSSPLGNLTANYSGRDVPADVLASQLKADAQRHRLIGAASVEPGMIVVHSLHGVGQVLGYDPPGVSERMVRVRFDRGLGIIPIEELSSTELA